MRLRKDPSEFDGTMREARAAKGRRREGRGFGPFSGGQLTAIILGVTIAIAFPVGAWAISGTTVFVTDNVTGKTAAVNASRQLSVAATGSVTATPTPPNAGYTVVQSMTEIDGCRSLTAAVPAGKALVVTSVTATVTDVTRGPVFVNIFAATPGPPCVPLDVADSGGLSGTGATQVFPIPSGFAVKAGHVLGASLISTSSDADAAFVVHGYLVSSTLCTVTGPPTGCN